MSSRRRRPPLRSAAAVRAVGRDDPCPCGEPATYAEGCGRLHGGAAAGTPLELMRSRYCAFVTQDAEYLLDTWAVAERPPHVEFDHELRWTGLEIIGTTGGTAFHPTGTVEFRARFEHRGIVGEHHERSRFIREDGRWVYDLARGPGE